jgi:hypothetical protein
LSNQPTKAVGATRKSVHWIPPENYGGATGVVVGATGVVVGATGVVVGATGVVVGATGVAVGLATGVVGTTEATGVAVGATGAVVGATGVAVGRATGVGTEPLFFIIVFRPLAPAATLTKRGIVRIARTRILIKDGSK